MGLPVLDLDRTYFRASSLGDTRRVYPVFAELCPFVPIIPRPPMTQAQRRGVRYERIVQKELEARHGIEYLPSPWIRYTLSDGRDRYCQPDGLLIRPDVGTITIVEVKLSHTERAFEQLFNLYLPVVKCLIAGAQKRVCGEPAAWKFLCCEVTRFVDCAISIPGEYMLVNDLTRAREEVLNVHLFNPKWQVGAG